MAIRVQEHVPLGELTTLKIGGAARYFVLVSTVPELQEAVSFAREKKLPIILLGGGSNVLLSDTELNAVVVQIAIRGIDWNYNSLTNRGVSQTVVTVGAGESWDGLVEQAVKRGLWGIENLSGIPGTVGAAPIQNIGAYGAEITNTLEWAEVLDTKTGKIRTLTNRECFFGYRDSVFKTPKGRALVITQVALRLKKNGVPNLEYKDLENYFTASYSPFVKGRGLRAVIDLNPPSRKTSAPPFKKEELKPTLRSIRRAVLDIRAEKFPDLQEVGTAGSFFKNPIIPKEKFDELKKRYPNLPGFPILTGFNLACPSEVGRRRESGKRFNLVKIPLAWILDNICGLKGHRKGNVALFERQPIVLVNLGGATAEEIQKFSNDIIRRVHEETGIKIQHEVIHIS